MYDNFDDDFESYFEDDEDDFDDYDYEGGDYFDDDEDLVDDCSFCIYSERTETIEPCASCKCIGIGYKSNWERR